MGNLRDHYGLPRAIVYMPDAGDIAAVSRCVEYVKRAGYRLVGIVTEWPAVERMLAEGTAVVAVVDRRADIPLDPRLHVVAELPADSRPIPRANRTARTARLSRRNAGA